MIKKFLAVFLFFSSVLFPQNDINNRFMLAVSYEQAGEFEKAKNILVELYQRAPDNYQFFDALNRIYLQLKNYSESETLIINKLSVNPQDVNLYGLLGKTYHLKGEEQKAFDIWEKAIEVSNDNPSVYRLISNYAIERRAFNKAIEVLNRGKEKSGNALIFSFDLANLYSMTMNYKMAAEECLFILQENPNEIYNVRSRISSFINKPDALKETITVFESAEGNIPEIKATLAWLYTEDKKYTEAYKIYSEIDQIRGSNGSEIFNYAQLLYSNKEYKAASEVYSDLIDLYPSSPFSSAAKLGYAKSMEALILNEIDDVWKPMKQSRDYSTPETDKLAETYLDLSSRISTSDLHNEANFRAGRIFLYVKNDPDKAEELFKNILDNYPVSSFAILAAIEIASINLKKGNLDEAEGFLKKTTALPRSTEEHKNRSRLMMAELLLYKKEFESSQKILREITSNLKDNSANDAIEMSLLLNTKMNDSSSLVTYAEAEFLSRQERFEEAETKYASISSEMGGLLLSSLAKLREAEVKIALGKIDDSVKILEAVSKEGSGNIYADKALYLLGNIYEFDIRDPQKALGIYEKLLARFPASMYLDEAREHIISLKNKLS